MTRERIDNLADARRLSESYHQVHAQKAHTDDNVGAAPVHGVAGTGMDGIEVELDALASTERNLAGLHDQLMEQMRSATVLTDKLQDGSGPVAVRMREAFLRRADVDGGVQKALREYMEELFDVRVVILQTLAGYQRVDDEATDLLSRQIDDFGSAVR